MKNGISFIFYADLNPIFFLWYEKEKLTFEKLHLLIDALVLGFKKLRVKIKATERVSGATLLSLSR